ncbi:MAG: hypothetical protein ACOZAO_00875 [Patescibacteria group bacterium]
MTNEESKETRRKAYWRRVPVVQLINTIREHKTGTTYFLVGCMIFAHVLGWPFMVTLAKWTFIMATTIYVWEAITDKYEVIWPDMPKMPKFRRLTIKGIRRRIADALNPDKPEANNS